MIQHCCELCGVGCRHGSDLVLLRLWYRLAAVAPIEPQAWEPSYGVSVALKSKKKKIHGAIGWRLPTTIK